MENRRHPVFVRGTHLSHPQYSKYSPQERETCPKPPPPPPPKAKDDSVFWGAIAVVFLAAGFAVIAKRSPEIRDWLTIHAPWFDDFIAIMYEENMTYSDFAEKCTEDLRSYIENIGRDDKPKNCSLEGDSGKPTITVPERHEVETVKIREDGKECVIVPPPVITKNICEVEECLIDLAETVLNNYYTATEACVYYNKVVEEAMQNFSIPTVKKLHDQMAERIDLVNTSINNVNIALADLDNLNHYFECGVKAPKEAMCNIRGLINDYQKKLKISRIKYEWENDKSIAMDQHWQRVEAAVDKYTDENQTMFPEIKYVQDKLQLVGDPDLLLYHTYRYSQKLKEELNNSVVGMTERVNRAMDNLPPNKARDAQLQAVLREKRTAMDKEFRQRVYSSSINNNWFHHHQPIHCEAQVKNNDKILKDSLKKQCDRHQEVLKQKLIQKEKEATVKLNKMVAEKVAFEKNIFKRQLADMAAKLKVVEDKLNAHLKAERETKRSQELWVAGASLLRATKKGEDRVRVDKELKAIEKASGEGDKLVETVLKAIPESVRKNGIVPESVLRERYHRMESVALKVALVEHDGAPLPVYFLSWIQSALLFMKMSGIPQAEIDNPPKEPFKGLDTFDLLQRARFWMERGNLAAAIRYVSSLEGASRAAAASWTEDARSHLETRQAAEAVLAHAAALGLQYI
ncbi:MICOS complex subunit Mic60-like [Zerene cesonia]|uniref:MICOS complex subunit Mic60-like n=1 Tax=Zerene cesonia TaxID=33412 RepID=UPI0018E52396|nr:MICOS complex subunit Mic60-like [Zerene cesonia]